MVVLNQLDPANCSMDGKDEADLVKRATTMIANSRKMGCGDVVGPKDIVKGNPKVNVLLVAEMFNTKHGLDELEEKLDLAGIIDDDIEGTKEERAFRMWINSLGIEDVFINSLFSDLQDGMVLLKVIHRIDNTVVEWDRVQKDPNNVFKRGINCQVAIDACAKLKLSLVGIGAEDIRDGHKKLTLAVVWQLCRLHYLQIIGSKTEQDLLDWVGTVEQVTGFNDKKFASGKLLVRVAALIEPKIINWDLVTEGNEPEEAKQNAKYAISIARKLGATVFMVWDDVVEVNKKMILIFICSLYDLKHGTG